MKTPRIIIAVLFLACLGLGAWQLQLRDHFKAEIAALTAANKEEIARQADKLDKLRQDSLDAQQAEHDRVVKALSADFESKIDQLRKDQQTKMTTAFREFEAIFDGNKKTIDYINALETRVKTGQEVSKAEIEKLAIIATGISFLQKEYQKPFQEFRELENYLSRQAALSTSKPSSNFGFFKRMFNREFREAEKDYYRSEGARKALTEAQGKFATVYSTAQKKMGEVTVMSDAQVKKLYALIDDKEATGKEDLSSFFDNARRALRTHQEVLDFSPDKLPDSTPKVQP